MQAVGIDKKELNKKLARLAIPIAIQGIVSATLTMVDNLMVGRLGETELAAVGVGAQIFMIHFMLMFGLVGGSATFMAQFYGTGDMKNVRKVTGLAMTILAGISLLFFVAAHLAIDPIIGFYTRDPAVHTLAVTYVKINSISFLLLPFSVPMEMAFKATQQTRVPMISSTVVFSTNTLLNYILIFGKFGAPKLGVAGAAIGTVSARVLEVLILIFFANKSANVFRGPAGSYLGWSKDLFMRLLKNAAPTTGNELLWGLGQTMYVAAFNRIGTTEFAAYQAANTIANIFSFAAFSIGDAALIMIGERLGRGEKEYTWEMSKHLMKVGTGMGVVFGAIIMSLAKPLSYLFNLSPDGQKYTFYILLIMGAILWLCLYNGIHITGTLRGGGDTKFAMIAESGSVWLVAVPLAFLAATVWHVPIHIAVLIARSEEVVKSIVLTKRYLSKKWMNVMIKGL